jgi:hypothetical protein
MPTKIMNGFPLRRCSWFFNPIVPDALARKMIRWLDLVCLKQNDSRGVSLFLSTVALERANANDR